MNTLDDIRLEIERATERRAELLHVLAEGHDDNVAAEHAELEEQIARLWDEYREAKVRGRFGDRPQRSYGDRPQRSYGDRPRGERTDRDRSFGDRPQRSYGDRPQRRRSST